MIKISILENRSQPKTRTTQNGIRHFQEAYVQLSGFYPEQIEIPLKSPADAYAVGDYQLDLSVFRVGKFRNLEINPFELKLISMNQKPLAKAS